MLTKIFLSLISVSAVAQSQVTTTYQNLYQNQINNQINQTQQAAVPSNMTGSGSANRAIGSANTASTTQLNQIKNPAKSSNNMNSGAKSSNVAQLIGMGTNLGVSAFMATQCTNPDKAAWACPMAALSAAQAAQMLAGSGGSKQTAAASGGFGPGFDWGSGFDSNGNPIGSGSGLNLENGDGTNTTGQIVSKATKDISGIKNLLASKGYTYDPNSNTVTTPDGNKVPASAFSSPQAMAESGMFSPGQLSDFNEAMAGAAVAAADRARVIEAEMDEGGGGGGSAVAGSAGRGGRGGSGDGGPDWSKLFGNKDGKDKASKVAPKLGQGLDTRIGREGNIFEAISRTYTNEVAAGRTGMGAVAPAQQALNPGRKPSSLGNQ